MRSSTTPQYVPNTIIVRFRANASAAERRSLLASIGARVKTDVTSIDVASVKVAPADRASAMAKLQQSPIVAHAERDLVMRLMGTVTKGPNDTYYSLQWGLVTGGFSDSWMRSGRKVIVAVIDSGVATAMPDLAGVVMPGIDLVDSSGSTNDTNGHGTAVAGVIAARSDNGIGGAGVCSICKILPIKVVGSSENTDTALVASGIVRAANAGARVINVSMGAPQTIDALQQAVTYAASKGAMVIGAAGNSGVKTIFYPAGYPGVLSVAGSTKVDRLYSWSNHGSWVDIAAPGCNVAPLVAGGYGEFCGTSSATPLVAGLVALARSARPTASPAQITLAVERAAKRITADIKFGRIDANAAIAKLGGSRSQLSAELLG